MSDIVEKARGEWNDWIRHPDNAETFSLEDVCIWLNQRPASAFLMLADTIAALRTEVERLKQIINERHAEVEALARDYNTARDAHDDGARENDRLAARVKELEGAMQRIGEISWTPRGRETYQDLLAEARTIASAVLSGVHTEHTPAPQKEGE